MRITVAREHTINPPTRDLCYDPSKPQGARMCDCLGLANPCEHKFRTSDSEFASVDVAVLRPKACIDAEVKESK